MFHSKTRISGWQKLGFNPMLDGRDGGSPLLRAARDGWCACSSCCSCCLAGGNAANSHNKLVDPRFWRIWWWQTVEYRGAVASATWLNERRVAQIYLKQRIRLRRPRGSTNYCYEAISLTPLVEPNIKKKKPLFFPSLRNSFQQFETALKRVSVCLLSKTHPGGAEKGLFFIQRKKKTLGVWR